MPTLLDELQKTEEEAPRVPLCELPWCVTPVQDAGPFCAHHKRVYDVWVKIP